jgi:cytochrome c peroxidase
VRWSAAVIRAALLASTLAALACRAPSTPRAAAPAPPPAAAAPRGEGSEPLGCVAPAADAAARGEPAWSDRDWRRIRRMSPVPPPPPDPTNRYADDPAAAAFGRVLFDDRGLSRDGQTACASCHAAPHLYADLRPLAVVGTPPRVGRRNVPSLVGSAHKRWQTWDGSADSLWAQPLLAFENPREHGLTRASLAALVVARHGPAYRRVFGEAPGAATEEAAERTAAHVGKALAAYVRTLSAGPAPFDRWVAGDRAAMPPEAVRGLAVFLRVGCIRCHSGPMFTDGDFHAARFPDDPRVGPDRGALEGLARARASVLQGRGRHSDAPGEPFPIEPPGEEMRGRFVTPTLRGVALTAPYGHAGTVATLEAVVALYAQGGMPVGHPLTQGGDDPFLAPFPITEDETRALVAFLVALTPDAR